MMIRRRAELVTQMCRDSYGGWVTNRLARRFVREMMCDKANGRYTSIRRVGTTGMDALCTLAFHPALMGGK